MVLLEFQFVKLLAVPSPISVSAGFPPVVPLIVLFLLKMNIQPLRVQDRRALTHFVIEQTIHYIPLEQNLQTPYQFLHCVMPRELDQYDPQRLDYRGMPFSSHYMSIEGQCLMAEEGGYRVFPYAVGRYDQNNNIGCCCAA